MLKIYPPGEMHRTLSNEQTEEKKTSAEESQKPEMLSYKHGQRRPF